MKFIQTVCTAVIVLAFMPLAKAQTLLNDSPSTITLEMAIERTLNASPSIRASEEAVRSAMGGIIQARLRPNPEFSMETANVTGTRPYDGLRRAETTLMLGQKFERGSKREARVQLAKSDQTISSLTGELVRQDVIYAVNKAYVSALAAEAYMKNAHTKARLAQSLQKSIEKRVELGNEPAAALHKFTALSLDAYANIRRTEELLNMAKRHLASYWNGESINFELDTSSFVISSTMSTDKSNKPFQMEDASVDLVVFDEYTKRAGKKVVLEKANAKVDPVVKFGARQFRETGDVAALISVSVPLAVFDVNQGGIKKASAELRRAEWQAKEARQRLKQNINTQSARLKNAQSEVHSLQHDIIPNALKVLTETKALFERGDTQYLEIAEAQRALDDFQYREITALKEFHLARAALDRLLATDDRHMIGEETKK